MRFNIATYGEKAAQILANEWCHKMSYYYRLYLHSGGGAHAYSQIDHDNYKAAQSFQDLYASAPSHVKMRCEDLIRMKP